MGRHSAGRSKVLGVSGSNLAIEIEHLPFVSLALQHNAVPIVQQLRLQNVGTSPLGPLELKLRLGDGLSLDFRHSLDQLSPGQALTLREPALLLRAQELLTTTETTRSYLQAEVFQDSQVIHEQHWPLDVQAYNHWPGYQVLPDLVCSFVLPNHPAVAQVLEGALAHCPALDGYQSGAVQAQAEAIYRAIAELEIHYVTATAEEFDKGQKIRTPDQIMAHRQANCLDLTCLMAAALRRAGLHALLVMVKGHAFPAVWLRPEDDPDGPLSEVTTLQKCLALGLLLVFDSSSVCQGIPFEQAQKLAEAKLNEDEFELAFDLRAAQRQGLRPLPLRLLSSDGQVEWVSEQDSSSGSVWGSPEASWSPSPKTAPQEAWEKRLSIWKNRLLDTSTRNRLLDVRLESNRRLLAVLYQEPQLLLQELLKNQSFTLLGQPRWLSEQDPRSRQVAELQAGYDVVQKEVEENFRAHRLQIHLDEAEVLRRSLELFRADRINLEETGSSTLFLGLGSLLWYETERTEVKRRAPIALLPVELVRVRVKDPYKVRWRGEDIRINLTLLRKLKADFELDLSGLEQWPGSESEIPDLNSLFQTFRAEILNRAGWNVLPEVYLGSFSFAKLVMLSDLERLPQLSADSPLLRQFLTSKMEVSLPALEGRVDQRLPAASAFCVLDADSSQWEAVERSTRHSFVLQGPPGTGKSQTITNMIAHNLAQGRSVLFVAEKLAALEVVYRRLESTGLSPYCLQLHSNKVSKGEILKQLKEALEHRPTALSSGFSTSRLEEAAQHLDEHVLDIHGSDEQGLSVYQVLQELCTYGDGQLFECSPRGRYESLADRSQELRLRSAPIWPAHQHPWRHSKLKLWRAEDAKDWQAQVKQLQQELQSWLDHFDQAQQWGWSRLPRPQELPDILEMYQLLLRSPFPSEAFLDEQPWSEICQSLDLYLPLLQQRQELWAQLEGNFQEDLLGLDLDPLITAFQKWIPIFLLGSLMLWGQRRKLRRVAKGKLLKAQLLLKQLQTARQIVDLDQQMQPARTLLERLFGARWQGPHSSLKELQRIYHWSGLFRHRWQALADGSLADQREWRVQLRELCRQSERLQGTAGNWIARWISLTQPLLESVQKLQQSLQLEFPDSWQLEDWKNWLAGREWSSLPDWTLYQEAKERLEELGLNEVTSALQAEQLKPELLAASAARSWLQGWLVARVSHRFRGELQNQMQQRFAQLDALSLVEARQQVLQRLRQRIPEIQEENAKGELAILQRELKKQRNLKAPRQLFKEIGHLLARLKPCLLMSPLSIAQYLDPQQPPFDLVIFDEASQIAPWDALGALARGRQWVVVGDSRQLPPTSFFSSQQEEPDEVELGGSLESVLDECVAANLPQLLLNWHYRSRDERLIAFSNRSYYGQRLHTFPNAENGHPDRGLHWRYLPEGRFARSASRTNRVEAEALVCQLVEVLRRPTTSQSFGVVTFNQSQQTLIENLLDQARLEFPEIERHFTGQEPIFVKNLENVQGDERDVIYFSIAYAPDSEGRLRMEFGPLNRQGGERRLNVAVSRARHQMWVFSSLLPEQIDLSRTQAQGAKDLRAFLAFARSGGEHQEESMERAEPLSLALSARLLEKGWKCRLGWGHSRVGVDLAIEHPHRPGFLAALEWDGPNYSQAGSTRDRDRLRPALLQGLGWHHMRLWSLDWWRDPYSMVESIDAQLRVWLESGHTIETPALAEALLEITTTPLEKVEPERTLTYHPATLPALKLERELHQITAPQWWTLMQALLEGEAPIKIEVAWMRLVRHLGVRKLGSRIKSHFDTLLSSFCEGGQIHQQEDSLWQSQEQAEAFVGFRVGKREIEDIPACELRAALSYELKRSISLTESELIRAACHHFGKQSSSKELWQQQLAILESAGLCRRMQQQWIWLQESRA